MRFLTLSEVLDLQRRLVEQSEGANGLRDLGLLESAVAQPRMAFGGIDLYPSLDEKAAALAFSLIRNHPFVDGNKRIGHAALESFLLLNGSELIAEVEESERIVRAVAAGSMDRFAPAEWIRGHRVVG